MTIPQFGLSVKKISVYWICGDTNPGESPRLCPHKCIMGLTIQPWFFFKKNQLNQIAG